MGKPKQIFTLMFFLLLCLGAGWAGSAATLPAIPTWYQGLIKPPLNPPQAVFGPVWTMLYIMMAVAAWLVWRQVGFRAKEMLFFFTQLILNSLWSFLFFAWRHPDYAFIDIILLWLAILLTLMAFGRVRPLAGALLIPYLAWVSFAAYLNVAIWLLNKG